MKTNYFFRTLATVLFCSIFSTSFAADFYISSTGSDTSGDGTLANPWASFTKAQTAASTSDVIHVSGLIDFSLEPSLVQPVGVAIAKNLTIQGTSNVSDGFDGKNLTRFFSNTTFTLTLKNLKLVNGYSGNNNGGAIINTSTGTLNCENVIFDANKTGMNTVFTGANKTGAAIHFDNATGSTFKNCVFSNNEASKAGAIYITAWASSSTILFEGCSFVGNIAKESFGGSAILIRANTSTNATCSFVNSTFKGNLVNTAANGGAIYFGNKSLQSTNVNIINCTVSENKTAGSSTNGAGVVFLNTAGATACIGNLYIQNTIIENNTTTAGAYSDLFVSAVSPATAGGGSGTVPGFIKIQNSIIGSVTSDPLRVPVATNIVSSPHYNYLTAISTTNDFKANLAPFNSTTNSYPLYSGSVAIGYGNSAFLTGLSPAITTDQLGNTRTVGATNFAGAWESTPIATTMPDAPTSLVATAGNGQLSLTFKTAATGGSNISNYKYSLNDGAYVACDPAVTVGPIVITGLTNGTPYTVKLKAVNANGESTESATSNSVTPDVNVGVAAIIGKISIYSVSKRELVVRQSKAESGTIAIYNAHGIVLQQTYVVGEYTTVHHQLPQGIYIVKTTIDGVSKSFKLKL